MGGGDPGSGSLTAPELMRVEATNILRRLERAKELSSAEANGAHEDLMLLDIHLFSFEPFAERVWELRHNLTSCDAWYVAVGSARPAARHAGHESFEGERAEGQISDA